MGSAPRPVRRACEDKISHCDEIGTLAGCSQEIGLEMELVRKVEE
jgi:hypothetical protein